MTEPLLFSKGPTDFVFQGFKVVEGSTGHMTKEDKDLLEKFVGAEYGEHPQSILGYIEGFFVSTWHNGEDNPEDFEKALTKLGHSPAYINLVMLAHRAGAKWLNLDCDGTAYDWLPRSSW